MTKEKWNLERVNEMELVFNFYDKGGEPYFSWAQCELCGSKLGDNRYDFDAWEKGEAMTEQNRYDFAVCEDCALYLVNGEVPA